MESDKPLEIRISLDQDKRQFVIQDYGIGMTLDELNENLGTIARSGSKSFLEKLEKDGGSGSRENIIGQFGVGFYSTVSTYIISENGNDLTHSMSIYSLWWVIGSRSILALPSLDRKDTAGQLMAKDLILWPKLTMWLWAQKSSLNFVKIVNHMPLNWKSTLLSRNTQSKSLPHSSSIPSPPFFFY